MIITKSLINGIICALSGASELQSRRLPERHRPFEAKQRCHLPGEHHSRLFTAGRRQFHWTNGRRHRLGPHVPRWVIYSASISIRFQLLGDCVNRWSHSAGRLAGRGGAHHQQQRLPELVQASRKAGDDPQCLYVCWIQRRRPRFLPGKSDISSNCNS